MLEQSLAERGCLFVHAPPMRDALNEAGSLSDWPAFAASWNDLEIDRDAPRDDRGAVNVGPAGL